MTKRIDGSFAKAVDVIAKCKGRVIVTGMGKTGIVGRKIAATLSSTGTPSLWMHSAEAVHGDLGQVTRNDIVIVISSSGETDEIKRLLPLVKKIKSMKFLIGFIRLNHACAKCANRHRKNNYESLILHMFSVSQTIFSVFLGSIQQFPAQPHGHLQISYHNLRRV